MLSLKTHCLASALLMGLSLSPRLPASETLSWKQVLQEAQQRNPTLVSARTAVQEADEGITIASAPLWPSLSAVASYNHSDSMALANLPAQNLLSGESSTGNGYSAALQGSWNLFDGFATVAARLQSIQVLSQRKAAYDVASATLLLSLRQAFLQLVYDQKNQSLLQDLADRYNQDTRYQSLEFASGQTARWTYLKAESDEASVKWQLSQNALSTRADQANLAGLMGRDLSQASSLVLDGDLGVASPPDDDQAELESIIKTHPSLQQQEALVSSNESALAISRASRYPTLDASGSYGTSGSDFNSPNQNQFLAGLTLKFNLFTGGGQEASIRQADLSLQASSQDLRDLRIQIQSALHKAWANFLGDYERLPVAHMATAAGEERFKTVQKLYEAGRAAFLDYEQAESIYTQAQQQELQEILSAALAGATYDNALGKGLEAALAADEAPPVEKKAP
jgi:outer membrane protein